MNRPSPRPVLFLSHAASRNGASVLLLHLLRWLRQHTDIQPEVFCEGGGPLLADFRDVARTHVAPAAAWPRAGETPLQAALRARVLAPALRAMLANRRPRLVYANTTAAWNQVAALARADVPLLWHVHELPFALALTLPTPRARALLSGATRVVAVSEAVRDVLVRDHGLARGVVDVVNGFVPAPMQCGDAARGRRAEVRAAFGWPDDAQVVGACGGPGWRKGSDLFLQAARHAVQAPDAPDLRFLWVGGDESSVEARQFDHDARALGLQARVRRVASTADVDSHYAAMDVFALTSREDPFPLVMLEAAGHALPLTCFDDSGGGVEFARQGTGVVVPHADAAALGRTWVDLARDAPRRRALGQEAARRVARHHRVEVQAPRMLRSIEACLADPLPAPARMAWR